jgi:16S rRNA (cytosine967-C5)-methyltransferase
MPSLLIREWLDEFGVDALKQICIASNRRSSIYLRPNTIKINTYHLAEMLTAGKVQNEITPDEKMLKLIRPGSITKIPGFDKGLFTVQNLSAAKAVDAMEPKAGWKILDLCSAPGTKTTQLAELTEDKAKIFATDIDATRLEKVKENAQRLGLSGIEVFDYSQLSQIAEQQGPFDAVLIDVPCSNTGVLAKRPEVRLRIKQKSVENLMLKQAELLKTASDLVKRGGIICYSTCSIMKSENQQQVQNFISENSTLQLVTEELILPSAEEFDHDGGYYAVIKKIS